jgi:hypothetical protein
LDQPLGVVWDRLPAHRSRLVQDYLASLQGWIATAYLDLSNRNKWKNLEGIK